MARGLKFQIEEVETLNYLCSENKGADQQQLRLLICAFFLHMQKNGFCHDMAHTVSIHRPIQPTNRVFILLFLTVLFSI